MNEPILRRPMFGSPSNDKKQTPRKPDRPPFNPVNTFRRDFASAPDPV